MNIKRPSRDLVESCRQLVMGLFDLQFETIITTQMLPVIYGLALSLAGFASLYTVVWAFGQEWWLGLIWLLMAGPALFVALAITIRVVLEFVLTVFKLGVYVELLGNQVDSIAGQTEGIAEDLPRIRFWKSLTRRGDSERKKDSD